MSNFTGAVQVENEKIEESLRVYSLWRSYHLKYIADLEVLASRHVMSWGGLKKWWHSEFFGNCTHLDMFYDKYASQFDYDRKPKALSRAGLISARELEYFEWNSFRSYSEPKDQLKELVTCGKPVFLNVEQAKFVNDWSSEN